MLEVCNLSSGYGDVRVLHDVTLSVDAGEIVSIVGANGAGKTTLMRTIMGTARASAGRIRFLGESLNELPTHEIARLGIAQVLEGRRLFAHMSAQENLLVGADILRDRAMSRRNLGQVYELFPKLAERRHQLARSFSGGEQQMVAIARAMMTSPKLLLLDEPSIGLAPLVVKEIFAKLPVINRQGITILLVEQDVQRSLSLATRGYVIEQGSVVMQGSGADLLASSELSKHYLGI